MIETKVYLMDDSLIQAHNLDDFC